MNFIFSISFFCYLVAMRLLILSTILLELIVTMVAGFICPTSNGLFENPDDYRSYYTCSRNCPQLKFCSSPEEYFSKVNNRCSMESTNWQPEFDLTGRYQNEVSTFHYRQDGYKFFLSHDYSGSRDTVFGRYINRTHIAGILTRLTEPGKCVAVYNALYVGRKNRALCFHISIHPQSSLCGFPPIISGCHDYTTI